ncbi:MAG: dephospho-CoA kinase [Acidimicrobiia bacterium]|nr:dephospho-CoA kinase [Acidimicrobiia bacterium]
MLLVGLTGGIGSGKSTVADLLVRRGAVVVDADAVARSVVERGMPALAALVERFGEAVLGADGALDRPKLAELAFADEQSRKDLEAITHPAINTEFLSQMQAAPADAIVVCDVPLLAESEQARGRGYPVIVVVEAPLDLRLGRLEGRGVPRADAARRMAAQVSDEERRAIATHVIDNSGDLDALERQVDDLWTDLLRIKAEHEAKADKQTAGE